jgi:hypothetical protein
VRAGKESDGGGGDDAGGFDYNFGSGGGAGGGEAGGEGGGDPVGGFTRIHSNQHAWWLRIGDPAGGFAGVRPRRCADEDFRGIAEVVGEGDADGVDGGGVERILACYGTNAVGSEQLLHQKGLH